MNYESVRQFAAVFGFLILASTYAFAVFWTFRKRARSAHEHAARIIFEDENSPSTKDFDRGR